MPEGDTIHRSAARLARVLVGERLTGIAAPRLRDRLPQEVDVTAVEARGKHLLVHLSDGHVLHTHLRMNGTWHVYPTGRPWQRPRSRARLVLSTASHTAVCFDAPVVELLDDAALRRHPELRALGPDLAVPNPDIRDVLARLARLAVTGRPTIEVLLDQRIAAGIGNVIASETCFLAAVAPKTPIEAVTADERRRLFEVGAGILRANLDRTSRTSVPEAPDGTLWVYGRAGRPCRRCGTVIVAERVGRGARPAYWCPTCQPSDQTLAAGHNGPPKGGTSAGRSLRTQR